MFNCLPSQLRAERLPDILAVLACADTEAEVQKMKSTGLPAETRGAGRPDTTEGVTFSSG